MMQEKLIFSKREQQDKTEKRTNQTKSNQRVTSYRRGNLFGQTKLPKTRWSSHIENPILSSPRTELTLPLEHILEAPN